MWRAWQVPEPHGTILWEGKANGDRRCIIQFHLSRFRGSEDQRCPTQTRPVLEMLRSLVDLLTAGPHVRVVC